MIRYIDSHLLTDEADVRSARRLFTSEHMLRLLLQTVVIAVLLVWQGATFVRFATGLIVIGYCINVLWHMKLFGKSMRTAEFREGYGSKSPALPNMEQVPMVSAFIPIFRENPATLKRLAKNLSKINYPEDRLQIMLLLDSDQQETIEAAEKVTPDWIDVVVVTAIEPRTKPRVLNSAMPYSRGEYIVVWDVEDAPDPDQLLKAVDRLERAKITEPDVMGVQARLAFDTSGLKKIGHMNWFKRFTAQFLVRWQASAYNMHFGMFLPGLDLEGSPIPLGGTSNVFRKDRLLEVGGWDPWNVTEDMDLGIRLARHGYRMVMIDSETVEEPNTELWNCIRQWSRWEKGAMQTWLVHMRSPIHLYRDLGFSGFMSFQLSIGLQPLLMLANPIFILMTVVYVALEPTWVSYLFPPGILQIGNFCLIVGNLFYLFRPATASLQIRQYGLVWSSLFGLGHWMLLSFAAWMALKQMVFGKAHHWEATVHGQTLIDDGEYDSILEDILAPRSEGAAAGAD